MTLSGTVSSWTERTDAVSAAWSAPGVIEVIDNISVRTSSLEAELQASDG